MRDSPLDLAKVGVLKTVVLVGAGASLAEALPSQPSGAMTPPLDATFFRLCERAQLEAAKGSVCGWGCDGYPRHRAAAPTASLDAPS